MISFVGGLPNRDLFPATALQAATNTVFESAGRDALQYSNSEGYLPLREWIAARYHSQQTLEIDVDNILITFIPKLIVAKQASDLHTNYLSQRIIHQYLVDNDVDEHIAEIVSVYGRQRDAMIRSITTHFPPDAAFTWPDGISSMALFDRAIAQKVAFVPGNPFYVTPWDANTFRLNFSCVDETTLETGIRRLGDAISEMI